jgi:voltage-gated potassium channel
MIEHAITHNILSIRGSATDGALLKSIGINKGAITIIALTDNDAVNLSIILTARSLNKDINIIARANNDNIKGKLKIAGANSVVAENEIASLVATEYLGQPIAFDAIDDILLNSNHATMDEIEITNNSPYVGQPLKEVDFDKFNLTFIGLLESKKDHKFYFNPPKEKYILEENDVLIVIGYAVSIKKIKIELLSKKSKK